MLFASRGCVEVPYSFQNYSKQLGFIMGQVRVYC